MRLPYVADPPPVSSPSELEIVNRVRARRGARGLTGLDRTLLHSIPIADGWNTFLGAIRTRTSLTQSIRETAICRVAVLNRAWYELEHHAPLLLTAEISEGSTIDPGFTLAILTASPGSWGKWRENEKLKVPDEKHALVLEFTDSLTLLGPISNSETASDESKFGVSKALFSRLETSFSHKEIVELVGTIASYNCVSRFLLALDVGEREGEEGMQVAIKNVIQGKGGAGLGKLLNVENLASFVPAPRVYV